MAVISKLNLDGKDITKYNNASISNISIDGVNYHFADKSTTENGTCVDAVNEPLIDMQIQGNSIQQILPIEYQEVEYLENSGTQRIDVGLIPTNSTSIDMTYQSLAITGQSQYILGSRTNASTTVE
jgi:hypothetical protein